MYRMILDASAWRANTFGVNALVNCYRESAKMKSRMVVNECVGHLLQSNGIPYRFPAIDALQHLLLAVPLCCLERVISN